MSTKDKVPFFVSRCEEMGIEVLPPDVNESGHDFVVIGGNIRFGLEAVKGVGGTRWRPSSRPARRAAPFTSIWDFCERVDCRCVNKKAMESLVQLRLARLPRRHAHGDGRGDAQAQAAGVKSQQDAQMGQGSIFDLDEPAPRPAATPGAPASAGASAARRPQAAER